MEDGRRLEGVRWFGSGCRESKRTLVRLSAGKVAPRYRLVRSTHRREGLGRRLREKMWEMPKPATIKPTGCRESTAFCSHADRSPRDYNLGACADQHSADETDFGVGEDQELRAFLAGEFLLHKS